MATHLDSSPEIKIDKKFISENLTVGIVTAVWNNEITGALEEGAINELSRFLPKGQVIVEEVPGSFELPLAAQYLIEYKKADAVICLGCLIRGETAHFDYISQAVSQKIADLNLKYNTPVIFGVLTTETFQQARERSGGRLGNKGAEAATTALKMLEIKSRLSK